jgi:hypothetical protein
MQRAVECFWASLVIGYFFIKIPILFYPECHAEPLLVSLKVRSECKTNEHSFVICLAANMTINNCNRVVELVLQATNCDELNSDTFLACRLLKWREWAMYVNDYTTHWWHEAAVRIVDTFSIDTEPPLV